MLKHISLVCLAAASVVVAFAQSAEARNVAAEAGVAVPFSHQACWSQFYGAVSNTCSTTESIHFPLPYDNAGNKGITISAYGATSANDVFCSGASLTWDLNTLTQSGRPVGLSTFGTASNIVLPSFYGQGFGILYANCQVNSGGRIQTINWNP